MSINEHGELDRADTSDHADREPATDPELEAIAAGLEKWSRKVERKAKETIFGFAVRSTPSLNFRWQFEADESHIRQIDPSFLHAWRHQLTDPVSVTFSDPDVYYTALLRTTIAGIESTISGAVREELLFASRLTKTIQRELQELRGGNMAELYYNKLPAKVAPSARLATHNEALWKQVQRFYTQVRNPLAHGNQLHLVQAESLRSCFLMFREVFSWIDTWHSHDRILRILSSTTFRVVPPSTSGAGK